MRNTKPPRTRVRSLGGQRLTQAQVADIASKVSLARLDGKGWGLVARKRLPSHTPIGTYAGQVYRAADYHRAFTAAQAKYAIDFFVRGPRGRVDTGYIMDPSSQIRRKRANVLAAFINEPTVGQRPNVVWVRNYESGTMQLWTMRPVRRGEEVSTCYGPGYARTYKTPCTRSPQYMHFWKKGLTKPRPVT